MGVWGTSLYSGDYAQDLRATIGAVLRLPFEADDLIALLRQREPAAEDPRDEDHTTFWLVVADQFTRKGVDAPEARERALEIIDGRDDTAILERLGMKPADLRKRARMLAELRTRLAAGPADAASRRVLKKPQPLLMEVGDLLAYPTCEGKCVNPYFRSRGLQKVYANGRTSPWHANGWAAMTIVDSGRAFGYLAWYTPLVVADVEAEKPTLDSLRGGRTWVLRSPGTCSRSHFRKMELERVGTVPIDRARVAALFPALRPGVAAAVGGVSIANSMSLDRVPRLVMAPALRDPRTGARPAIPGLGALAP